MTAVAISLATPGLLGKKRPKLHTLRSKLFGKMKRKGEEGAIKHTHSASDITQGILDIDADYYSSQNTLGTRSLSHDSIFLADQCQSDPGPPRILSQENTHGKIRTLQMKLQQQNMHLGPPPLVLPIKHVEESGGEPEEKEENQIHPQSSSEVSGLSKNSCTIPIHPKKHISTSLSEMGIEEQRLAQPVSPRPPTHSGAPLLPSVPCSGVDFNTPPKFTPCLDSSAARHRMSIKPRNQRASTKSRRVSALVGGRPEIMNNVDQLCTESKEAVAVTKEITRVRGFPPHIILPGQGLIAPPIRNPHAASPLSPLAGAGDEYFRCAVSQPEETILPSPACLPHSTVKQQTPGREDGSSRKPEFSETPTSALGSKQAPKVVEVMTSKLPSPAVSTSVKGCEDHKEIQVGFRLKSSQDSATLNVGSPSTPCLVTMDSEQNQLQSEKGCCTVAIQEKDNLSKNAVKDISHKSHPEVQSLVFPQDLAVGVALRPPSQRRNTAPSDNRVGDRNQQALTAQVDKMPKESTYQPRPVSGSLRLAASPAKSYERQRTASFTGVLEQAGSKRELPPPPIYSKNLKMQDQLRSTQLRPKGIEQCTNLSDSLRNERSASIPVVQTRSGDLTPTLSAGQEKWDVQAYEAQEKSVAVAEVQKIVETMDEAKKYPKGNDTDEEEKHAFGVKLRTTSLPVKFPAVKTQSEFVAKQQRTEVSRRNTAWVPEPLSAGGHNDSHAGPARGNLTATVFKKSLTPNTEPLTSTKPLSTVLQSESRVPERTISAKMSDMQTSSSPSKEIKLVHSWAPKESMAVPLSPKEDAPVPLFPKESTQVSMPPKECTSSCMLENTPLPTAGKEPSSELSWMSVAREKTRNLQQLFTSRLPDFPGLPSAMRPTSVAAHSQSSGGPGRPTHQVPPSQPIVRPLQAVSSPPAMQTSAKAMHMSITQPLPMEYYSRPLQPTTETGDLFLKQTLSTTGQTQFSSRPMQSTASTSSSTYSTAKPVQSAAAVTPPSQLNTQTVHTSKQALFHLSLHQAHPVQSVTRPQESQAITQLNPRPTQPTCLHPSPSPKLAIHQTTAVCAPSPQMRPQVGVDGSSMFSGKMDITPLPHEKSPVESKVPWAGSLGSKAFPSEHLMRPTSEPSKIEDQKGSLENRCPPAFRTMSSHKASSGLLRVDKEDTWQKTTSPSSPSPPSSSSSSPPQSIRDSGQPSWMEMAKRKSLAWSDKTMD